MKYLKYIMLLIASIVLFSCSDEDFPTLSTDVVAPVLLAPDSTYEYVLLEENSDNPFETFIYTAADFGQQVVVNYAIQVDTMGGDFSSAPDAQSPVQTLYQTISTKDFNLALATLKLTPEVKQTVQVRVRAFLNDPSATAVYSEAIELVVTPFDASFPPIYAVGDATTVGWDAANAIPVLATTITLFEGELEMLLSDDAAAPYTFRFLKQQAWGEGLEYDDFDLIETVPEGLLLDNVNEYDEHNFQPTQAGTYKFTINLDNNGKKTLKAELLD